MGKFRFSNYTPAKVAKVAKVTVNKGYPPANRLLKSAKVDRPAQESSGTLAIVSNTLAEQETCKIKNLSRISNISKGSGINPKNASFQDQIDTLWIQSNKLADWIDNPDSDIPWQKRAARVPVLQRMSKELDKLEKLIQGQPEIQAVEKMPDVETYGP